MLCPSLGYFSPTKVLDSSWKQYILFELSQKELGLVKLAQCIIKRKAGGPAQSTLNEFSRVLT